MPKYKYKCENCDHQFEIKQNISDQALTQCPKCHGEIFRVITPTGIAFKGTGFHINDYNKIKQKSDSTANCTSCKQAKSCPKSDSK